MLNDTDNAVTVMILMRSNYRKGFLGFTPAEISARAASGAKLAVIDGGIYDMSEYITNNGFVSGFAFRCRRLTRPDS